jgi:hypothetical protein
LGAGTTIGGQQWSAGLYGEFRLNTHWRLGLGIVSIKFKGDSYLTETDYDEHTKQKFRPNFAPGVAQNHDIINITPSGSSWQIPLLLSYRVGLGSGWSLVPSAGVNLSISSHEQIKFAYFRGSGIVESVNFAPPPLPQRMFHTGSAAIYLEKNWGDWALQLGPYGSTPLSHQPSRLNVKTMGASARLFYRVDWTRKR